MTSRAPIILPVLLLAAAMSGPETRAATVRYPVAEAIRSWYWAAEVDGGENGVGRARTMDSPWNVRARGDHGGEYAFTSFAMDRPVRLTVRPLGATPRQPPALDDVRILPSGAPVKIVRKGADAVELLVERPCKFSVEPAGREHPLLVFARGPERNLPAAGDPKVKMIGPGVVAPAGGKLALNDGETLYLRPGTVLKAGVELHRVGNVRVCGRGVIDGSDFPWGRQPTPCVIRMLSCRNVRIEGVTIVGGWQWNVVPWNSEDVLIEDVAVCGARVWNDDGINVVNSRRVAIRDCFVRTDDDCFCMKGCDWRCGPCEKVTVENCVFWCDRARVMLLGWVESSAPYIRDLVFRNNDIIHFAGPVFTCVPLGGCTMGGILIEDVRINNERKTIAEPLVRVYPKSNPKRRNPGFGQLDGVTIRNVVCEGPRMEPVFDLKGSDAAHPPRNVSVSPWAWRHSHKQGERK